METRSHDAASDLLSGKLLAGDGYFHDSQRGFNGCTLSKSHGVTGQIAFVRIFEKRHWQFESILLREAVCEVTISLQR